jgi:hypothetical protein
VSDFDNFDDLDAIRDFRSLAAPFPGAVDAAIRQRVLDLALSRGYGTTSPESDRDREPAAGTHRSSCGAMPAPVRWSRAPRATDVLELRGFARSRTRPRLVVTVTLVVVLALLAAVVARRAAPIETLDVGGAIEQPVLAPVPAPIPVLTVEGWRELAAMQPDRPVPAGQYEYRRVERGSQAGYVMNGASMPRSLGTEVRERWAAPDRPGRLVARASGPGEVGAVSSTGSGAGVDQALQPDVAFSGLSYDQLRWLPTDSASLWDQMVATAVPAGAPGGGAIASVLDRLSESVVRSDVRASLVTLLQARGLRATGPTTDRKGRAGDGFTLTDGSGTWTLVVDHGSGAVLSWEHRPAGSDVPDAFMAVVETRIVHEVPVS